MITLVMENWAEKTQARENIMSHEVPSIWLEIENQKGKNLIIDMFKQN